MVYRPFRSLLSGGVVGGVVVCRSLRSSLSGEGVEDADPRAAVRLAYETKCNESNGLEERGAVASFRPRWMVPMMLLCVGESELVIQPIERGSTTGINIIKQRNEMGCTHSHDMTWIRVDAWRCLHWHHGGIVAVEKCGGRRNKP